ncbi:MAG: Druantia anti-phage system protein DruA [Terriglobales bacterium]
MLKLEAQGEVVLPAVRRWRKQPRVAELALEWAEPEEVKGGLKEFSPVRVEVVQASTPAAKRWARYVERYHYLGLHVGGEKVRYLAQDAQGRDLACVLFGAAAWKCAPRDRHLGITEAQRQAGLQTVANNTRFLILPWVRIPALASHVLGQVARRIDADWQAKYGHGLQWLETFVERGRFAGTCYRAANWECVGQTTGRSCEDRHHTLQVPMKDVYLYQLRR